MPNIANEEKQQYQKKMLVNSLLSPGIAGIVDRFAFHPADTIASYQQNKNINFKQATKYIYGQFGFRGFYHGLSVPLVLSSIPAHLIFFGTYTGVRELLFHTKYNQYYFPDLIGSVVTSFLVAGLSTPIEAKRIRDTFNIRINASEWTYRNHFKGFSAMIVKFGVQLPVALAGTDILKDQLSKISQRVEQPRWRALLDPKHPATAFCCGFFMGGLSQALSNPFDVIKTRVMSDYSPTPLSFWRHVRKVHEEGALFTSMYTRLGRFGTSIGLVFACMSLLNNLLIEQTAVAQQIDSPKRSP